MTEAEIIRNVQSVRENIARAAEEAGRNPAEIRLVAATKMNDTVAIRAAIAGGVDICGENRVQEMLEKNSQGAYEGVPPGSRPVRTCSLRRQSSASRGDLPGCR